MAVPAPVSATWRVVIRLFAVVGQQVRLISRPISNQEFMMNTRPVKLFKTCTVAVIAVLIAACADMSQSAKPARKITSCPPGQFLICETTQPLSKGGAEEEIPEYEYCRCK